MEYHRLSDEDYAKLKGQVRLRLNGVFKCFNFQGFDVLVPGAIDAIMVIIEASWKRIRGKDVPIPHTENLPSWFD